MICNTCGLPKELCVCENIAKENQEITVYTEKKKFGKLHTMIEGIDTRQIDLKDLAKKLKNTLACGGTFKDGKIELQGDHKQKVFAELVKLGFPEETIRVR
ncbi:TPA: stress response translation initiation inhibitor YciH [Candidatus Woesearchaeota archaeon]|nr:Protein translation factor SUI1-like protein [archaeon GW2011_AR15]MBS3103858.1 stress response translation initiation inhibitor YciH [Candidatus Woesearchaeota archaeon]HIH40816.1 stress response translation initiation inhibitor YciH [Candidatus Woesearchaeota archaeon]